MMDRETMDRELSYLRHATCKLLHRVGELEGRIMRVEREVGATREAPKCPAAPKEVIVRIPFWNVVDAVLRHYEELEKGES